MDFPKNDFSNFTIKDIVSYLDDRVFPLYEGDFHGKNKIVDEVFHNIRAIANAFCLLMGMSISMYDIWQAEEQNPEISEIIFGKIDPSLQPTEIEQELDRRAGRLIGKRGSTAEALREVISIAGKTNGERIHLKFVSSDSLEEVTTESKDK